MKRSRLLRVLFVLAAPMFSSVSLAAADFWNGLRPGQYVPGFAVTYVVDRTRSFVLDAPDAPSGRPVRVSIWYPAAGGRPLKFRDYVEPRTDARDLQAVSARLARANQRLLRRVLRTSADLERLMNTPVASVDAPRPAPGRFPIVLYASGWNEVWHHANFVLAEYLASHGYVVVSVPQLPPTDSDRSLGIDAVSLEAQLRDLELALATAGARSYADATRVATMGHSMGGVAALLLAMRHPAIDAVVGLDASYAVSSFRDFVTESPYFRPRTFQAPLLDLRRANDAHDKTVLDALVYADRHEYTFAGIQHADFTSFPMVAVNFPTDIEGRSPETAARAYLETVRTVHRFLDAIFGRAVAPFAAAAPAGVAVTAVSRRAAVQPPTEQEWARIVERKGADRAIEKWIELEAPIDEKTLNAIGYSYIADQQNQIAFGIFRLNAHVHPRSANAADSLAEGLLTNGDRAGAAIQYQRVLDLVPGDPDLTPSQKSELERNARQKLQELSAGRSS